MSPGRPRRRLVPHLAVLALALAVAACSSDPPVKVLFIGNSYTASNNLPGMVRQLGGSVGVKVDVEARAPGGWWLRDHVASTETVDAIRLGGFDYVVLQEQSMVPADPRLAERTTRPAALNLSTRINQSGARAVLFMTWGHRGGSTEVGHSSYGSMQRAIADSYERFGEAILAPVAPVGAAWWLALAERSDIALYEPDGSHPTREGSYLAAAVLAGMLLDVDPIEFDADAGLDASQAQALREIASRALSEPWPWS